MKTHLNWKINLYVKTHLLAVQQKQIATFVHRAEQQILSTWHINAHNGAWCLPTAAATILSTKAPYWAPTRLAHVQHPLLQVVVLHPLRRQIYKFGSCEDRQARHCISYDRRNYSYCFVNITESDIPHWNKAVHRLLWALLNCEKQQDSGVCIHSQYW